MTPLPITIGTREQFARVRSALAAAGYTAEAVAARAGSRTIYEFKAIYEGRTQAVERIDDTLDLLIRMFMDSVAQEEALVAKYLSEDTIEAMAALGLLRRPANRPDSWEASVLLYPAEDLWIISDADANPGRATAETTPVDVVYPAISRNTGRFLSYFPQRPVEHFLELCGGTGIAALRAARNSTRSWTADITERATAFADFNARLNGLENCTAVAGDLYEPLKGQTFDMIVAHPPYVPATEQKFIFRDGGEDGEQITRRIIVGLPEYLRNGGRMYCTCLATDRTDANLEQRVRAMLGAAEAEFDVVVVTMQEYDPLEYYARSAVAGRETFARVGEWYALFERLGIRRLVYSTIVVYRHGGTRPTITTRRQVAPVISPREVDWLLDWEGAVRDPGMPGALRTARPRVPETVDLMMNLRQKGPEWMPTEVAVGTQWPFMLKVDVPVWAATFLSRCDGKTTVEEHLAFFKGEGVITAEEGPDSFLRLVQILISAGILEIASHPLPPIPPPPPGAKS